MRVFIIWSGERSGTVARVLRDWLPEVLQKVSAWISKADIEAGLRWSGELAQHLEASDFGVICLTKENQRKPWIHFESGAIAKKVEEGRVCPYLIKMRPTDIEPGPLTLFQAK